MIYRILLWRYKIRLNSASVYRYPTYTMSLKEWDRYISTTVHPRRLRIVLYAAAIEHQKQQRNEMKEGNQQHCITCRTQRHNTQSLYEENERNKRGHTVIRSRYTYLTQDSQVHMTNRNSGIIESQQRDEMRWDEMREWDEMRGGETMWESLRILELKQHHHDHIEFI